MDTNSNESGMRKSAGAATDTPAGLSRTTILLRKLRAAAEVTMGRTLTYDELSDYTGEPRSTLGRWFNGDGGPSPEIILRLLELIPEKARHDLMDKPPFCRVYPRIDHPSISHDPVATSILNTIALKSTGLTLVQGDTDSTATFVATAIGHSSRIVGGSCTRQIMGLDVHKPDWFVPIPEVHYLRNLPHPKEVEKELEVLLPRIKKSHGAVVLLNGLFNPLNNVPQSVVQMATQSHMVLAAKLPARATQPLPLPRPANLVKVTSKALERLSLEFQVL